MKFFYKQKQRKNRKYLASPSGQQGKDVKQPVALAQDQLLSLNGKAGIVRVEPQSPQSGAETYASHEKKHGGEGQPL